ncbi:protein FAR1-RELATED SEQUENCE 5 [Elaeis guineensis]|uniref:Protein FAR1-RELATED SEQUENCE n=1 Tax=Elaeis guineensis var. tenera TaxID=51953 RepID=A0A6J0PPL5_ELAGV|nr:protein FAR1-RELATED SEQUENCE 5 [Elaeis guineensis]XP_010935482.1 protein FAR1-RELATED SEQUENCE 5 [Elaeis guineensis]XP_019709512.1 protein FAR1-RELATED SEQUENCE 5 [Elaeis guineensis]XP_029123493.1 protein FAR1-RELATED SEQUENCE 5 [Elaeis guineensis]
MVTSKEKMVGEELDEFDLASSEEETSSQEAMRLATEKYDRCDIYLGMEFSTDRQASAYYDMYAKQEGFRARDGEVRRLEDGTICARQYVCSRAKRMREGEAEESNQKRGPAVLRKGCPVMIEIERVSEYGWEVVDFCDEHNHKVVSPYWEKVHKGKPPKSKKKMDVRKEEGVQTNFISDALEEQTCGYVGVGAEDASNRTMGGKPNAFGSDGQIVLDYFTKWQVRNATCVFAVQLDDEQCLSGVFWSDARARLMYNLFSDVVIFDTTTKINGNKLLFATFLGVNNHAQLVFLGGALVASETEATFMWIFRSWLEAMHGYQPGCIITDLDEKIQHATSKMFPNSNHRLCKRHILKKVPQKLSDVCLKFKEFHHEFSDCICKSRTESEFENNWTELVLKYSLRSNEWVSSLYKQRHSWVPAYVTGIFSAGVLTEWHVEGVYSIFDMYINENTTLKEFIKQYETALRVMLEKEGDEEYKMICSKPELRTPVPMEQQAAEFYTRVMFLKFQKEFIRSLACIAMLVSDCGGLELYTVKETMHDDSGSGVIFRREDNVANCSCHFFESDGILCRHALTIFKIKQIFIIPDRYILRRWTKFAKNGKASEDDAIRPNDEDATSVVARFNSMFSEAIEIADKAALSKETYLMAIKFLRELNVKVGATPIDANVSIEEENVRQDSYKKGH